MLVAARVVLVLVVVLAATVGAASTGTGRTTDTVPQPAGAHAAGTGSANDSSTQAGRQTVELGWDSRYVSASGSVVNDETPVTYTVTEDVHVRVENGSVPFGANASVRLRVRNVDTGEATTLTPESDAGTYDVTEFHVSPYDGSVPGLVGVRFRPAPRVFDAESVPVSVRGGEVFDDGTFDRYVLELVDENGSVVAATSPQTHAVDVGLIGVRYNGTAVGVGLDASIPAGSHAELVQERSRDETEVTVEARTTSNATGIVASVAGTAFDPDAPFEVLVYENRSDPVSHRVLSLSYLDVGPDTGNRVDGPVGPLVDRGVEDGDGESRPPVTVGLAPSTSAVSVDGRRTVDVVVEGATDGIGAVALAVDSADPGTLRLVDVGGAGPVPEAGLRAEFGPDNSSVRVFGFATGGGTARGPVLTLAVEGVTAGEAALSLEVFGAADSGGEPYPVREGPEATVTVRSGGPSVTGSAPATDPDGDGLYEDVDGDGRVGVGDVVALFEHLDESPVRGNADAFDFTADAAVGVGDVARLFEEI